MGALAGCAIAPTTIVKASNESQNEDEPHFFLHVMVTGGMDTTYLFDARPLNMTDKGKIQNYCYKNDNPNEEVLDDPEPRILKGTNGTTTLRSPLTDELTKNHQKDFTVINGVTMLTNGFVGHDSNTYYLFTNQATRGQDSWLPILTRHKKSPLDTIHLGYFGPDGVSEPKNFGGSIQFKKGAVGSLRNTFLLGPKIVLESPLYRRILQRMEKVGNGVGLFAKGAQNLKSALENAPSLARRLSEVDFEQGDESLGEKSLEFKTALKFGCDYFKNGISSSMTLMVDRQNQLDTHSTTTAQRQVANYKEIIGKIDYLFKKLNEKDSFAPGKSMLDVTTVLISSEFSRTMRQHDDPEEMGRTATDHNPFCNTLIVAGKGIKTGQVIGASDLNDVDKNGDFINVSGAHKTKDEKLLSIIGKPFDFETGKPKRTREGDEFLPQTWDVKDYLNCASVTNTLMKLMGVDSKHYYSLPTQQEGEFAPLLTQILKD